MKRVLNEYLSDDPKMMIYSRLKATRIETIHFLVPHNVIGAVIGRSGKYIKEVEKQARCKVSALQKKKKKK